MKNAVQSWLKKCRDVKMILRSRAILYGGSGDRRPDRCLIVICCMLLAGCEFPVMDRDLADTSGESGEYLIPAHKPQTFESLVGDLQRRLIELTGPDSDTETDEDQQRTEELRDLVRWIPELSADSELRRADFEKAAACSLQLLQALDSLKKRRFQDSSRWMESLQILQDLVPTARDAG